MDQCIIYSNELPSLVIVGFTVVASAFLYGWLRGADWTRKHMEKS